MPQLRQNIITGEWVVIAPERAKRPSDFSVSKTTKKEHKESPFAVGKNAWYHRLKEYDTKNTYVIPNLYPAFVCDEKMCSTRSYYPESSFFRAKNAVGDHEVVVVKDQDQDLFHFTTAIWEDLFLTFQSRYLAHLRNPEIEYVMCIYNHGIDAGASISHPHAQIFASPIVPNYVEKEIEGAERYFNNNGVNVFTDLLHHEAHAKARVIAQNEYFLAHTFYAARFPFEIWVMPKHEGGHFEKISKTERKSLASIMQTVMQMLADTLSEPSVNFWVHCLPTTTKGLKSFTWHIEIAPRVAGWGGYELGSGVVIDVMSPEKAAAYLRKHKRAK